MNLGEFSLRKECFQLVYENVDTEIERKGIFGTPLPRTSRIGNGTKSRIQIATNMLISKGN